MASAITIQKERRKYTLFTFFVAITKYLAGNNLREKGLSLANREVTLWKKHCAWQTSQTTVLCGGSLITSQWNRKQREQEC